VREADVPLFGTLTAMAASTNICDSRNAIATLISLEQTNHPAVQKYRNVMEKNRRQQETLTNVIPADIIKQMKEHY
jgi:hypothetical protein